MRSRLFWFILVALIPAAFFAFLRSEPQNREPILLAPPSDDTVVLQGVQSLDLEPVNFRRDLDFGKGKFALFRFFVPQDLPGCAESEGRCASGFRLERLVVVMEGASDAEIPEAWLRFYTDHVYSVAAFENGVATFDQFPPENYEGLEHGVMESPAEKQIVVLPQGPLPRVFLGVADVPIGLYGHWTQDIAPRTVPLPSSGAHREAFSGGIRFCLKEISGTFVGSGKRGETRFAQPICWPRMGIQ